MKKNVVLQLSFAIFSLLVLPNCDWFDGGNGKQKKEAPKPPVAVEESAKPSVSAKPSDDDTSPVLLKIKGKPKITQQGFEKYKEKFAQAQPQYAPLLNDPNVEEQVFKGQVNEALLEVWAEETGLENDPKYKKDLDELIEFGKRSLRVKHFQDAHPVNVTDADIRKYYDENKDTPQLMISAGGIESKVVRFDDKEKAEAFYDKVKGAPAKFESVASDEKLEVDDLGEVNKQSFEVEGSLREKILASKSFPTVEMVQVKDKWAVYAATGKKDAEYVSFDDVKAGIKNFLEQQKSAENMMSELEKLEKKYGVEMSDYFEKRKKAKEGEQQKAAEAMKKQMEQKKAQKTAENTAEVDKKSAPKAA